MINQERVREMSRMAALEAGLGKKELKVSEYRRLDYVILQIVKGFIAGTICFAACFLVWFLSKWDSLNPYFADADYAGFVEDVLMIYGIFIVVYLVLCAMGALYHHKKCRRRRDEYLKYLDRLNRSYRADGGENGDL